MTEMLQGLFDALAYAIPALAGGIKDAFVNLLYVDPDATTKTISPLLGFIVAVAGLSIAARIFATTFAMVRGKIKGGV